MSISTGYVIRVKYCVNCGHDIDHHVEVDDFDCDFRCTDCGCEKADIGDHY